MNDLQISLLALGVIIVVGVYLYNRWQERKLKRRAEQMFQSDHEDVLLDTPRRSGEPRIEPAWEPAPEEAAPREEARTEPVLMDEAVEAAPETPAPTMPRAPEIVPPPAFDAACEIDYTVHLTFHQPVAASVLVGALDRGLTFGKPVHWIGIDSRRGIWTELSADTASGEFTEVKAALQLVNRQGAVSENDIDLFADMAQNLAADLGASVECDDKAQALAQAEEMDRVCAEADVLVGINVISGGNAIPATKVRAFAEANGMKLAGDGAFYFRNDDGEVLFTLGNMDSVPFTVESIKTQAVNGVTLLLDVPKVANGLRVFDQMLALARQMANSLGGVVVDDNRRPFTDAGAETIKGQVKEIYARMESAGIPAGSPQTLRLFS